MQLWLGQALYAAGRRGDALKLLLALKAHPDRDVAKVSKELVFILKAPELQLDESSRVGFDMDNFDAEAKFERAPDGTIKIMKRPEFEKPPEYGSVEWVLQQPRGEPPVGGSRSWPSHRKYVFARWSTCPFLPAYRNLSKPLISNVKKVRTRNISVNCLPSLRFSHQDLESKLERLLAREM